MSQELKPCIDLPLEKALLDEVSQKAKDWAIMHGAALRSKSNYSADSLIFAPFTLIPTSFPKTEFDKGVELQYLLNELVHKISNNHPFLEETLKETIQVDNFTKKLYDIYETVRKEGVSQALSLCILRGDYMLDTNSSSTIKQIEINTVATSLAGLTIQFSLAHRFVLNELGREDLLPQLPENKALEGLCKGMVTAHTYYDNPSAVILFVVEDISYNICDQRFHEFYIREHYPHVKIIRRSLTEIYERGSLGAQKQLLVDGFEISLVYFRSGYEPDQYHSEKEWQARLLMERSMALKCPAINYHLAGTKKVQQVLAQPGVLEKFLTSEKAQKIRQLFTGIYSLDANEPAIERALKNPEMFVLKPQREGGGHNVYGEQVRSKLKELLTSNEKDAWILMERIFPPTQKSYILRAGTINKPDELHDVVSELGIYGVALGDENKLMVNEQCGHMLRTKLGTNDEGGVAAGAGCLDSPFLI